MPDSVNSHNSNLVRNVVDHTVIANADAPIVLASAQLPAAGRPRIPGERGNAINHLIVNAGRKPA
jgi:hypothetical protein